MANFLRLETTPGTPVMAYGRRLIPFAQCLSMHLPGSNFRMVWNRPVSVLVTAANGEEQILFVRDPTRQIILALYAAAGVLTVFTVLRRLLKKGLK